MNAIILAAGMGSRLMPHTREIPKPLIKINGIPIIERQIEFLKALGINDIYVVTGHLSVQFEYLKKKYDVQLMFNPEYYRYNNIYSFYLCRDYFGDSWVLDGDVFLNRNFLQPNISSSTYFTGKKQILQSEWELVFDDQNILNDIIIHSNTQVPRRNETPVYVMSGISYWSHDSAKTILDALNRKISLFLSNNRSNIGSQYWDQLVVDNLDRLHIKVQAIGADDWIEIDCEYDFPKGLKI